VSAFCPDVCSYIVRCRFCDSNGDGYGDIEGIIAKLDYLKDLGVVSDVLFLTRWDSGADLIIGRDMAFTCI